MAMSEERKRQLQLLGDRLVAEARIAGKAIHEHAADTIADLNTSARDSIIRAAVVCGAAGTIFGFVVCMAFVK